MSRFTKELAFSTVGEGLYKTNCSFIFFYSDSLDGKFVLVPEEAPFNGASIPIIVQKIFNLDPIDNRWLQATVLHDCMVNEHGLQLKIRDGINSRIPTWMESAKWFNKALKVKKCPYYIRLLFVSAVVIYELIKNKK